jgi:hypothetical protein
MRALIVVLGLLPVLDMAPAMAADVYQSSVIVTGMDLRSRPAGLSAALAQVLAAASGNPAWLSDPRVAAIDPAPLLRAIAYLDRESDLPKHDEQGTRDRPYDLVATFDPAAIESRLRSWNDAPWTAARPTLRIEVTVTPQKGDPMSLHADTDADERHRAALLTAAGRFGITIWLPASLAPITEPPNSPVLRGTVTWNDAAFGWVSQWRLIDHGQEVGRGWGQQGVSFDAAYRDGIAGAVMVLSGH